MDTNLFPPIHLNHLELLALLCICCDNHQSPIKHTFLPIVLLNPHSSTSLKHCPRNILNGNVYNYDVGYILSYSDYVYMDMVFYLFNIATNFDCRNMHTFSVVYVDIYCSFLTRTCSSHHLTRSNPHF